MTKFDEKANMYSPLEFRLRYPEEVQQDAHWSGVWAGAFKQSAAAVLGKVERNLASIEFGVKVLRLAELSNLSYKQGSKVFKNI